MKSNISIATLKSRNLYAAEEADMFQEEKRLLVNIVSQGCTLSTLFFNLYSEINFKRSLEVTDIVIKSNGLPINNLRYSDDTVIMAESMEEFQFKQCE